MIKSIAYYERKKVCIIMKKTVAVVVSFLLVAFMLCSFAGCTVNEEELVQKIAEESQKEIKSTQDQLEGVMDISISARGTALVMTFKFVAENPAQDEIVDAMVSGMEQEVNDVLKKMKDAGVKSGSVIIEIFDMDGKELFSKEYK